jgi:periplasmic protein TonB
MKLMKLTLYILSLFVVMLFSEKVYSQALPNFGTAKKAAPKAEAKADESEYPKIDDFVAVDNQAEIVKRSPATYPELASKARIEGNVYLKVLIDKDGKAKKAVVFKTDADVFNEAAIESAMKSTYKAATSDGNPVAFWLVVPYSFKLK